jgi:hypothetical protein
VASRPSPTAERTKFRNTAKFSRNFPNFKRGSAVSGARKVPRPKKGNRSPTSSTYRAGAACRPVTGLSARRNSENAKS